MRARAYSWVAASVLLGGVATGHTWVVDDDGGPGVDFTEIADAVAAAAPGDRILVRPGSYASFVVTTPVTILGEDPASVVAGEVTVRDIAGPTPCVLSGLTFDGATVQYSSAAVFFIDVVATDEVFLHQCDDFRAAGSHFRPLATAPATPAVWIQFSTAEFSGCVIEGGGAQAGVEYAKGADGLHVVGNTARVHAAGGVARGGMGAFVLGYLLQAGSGGNGVVSRLHSAVLLSDFQACGGLPGWNEWYHDGGPNSLCFLDGRSGIGAVGDLGGSVHWTGVPPTAPPYPGDSCEDIPGWPARGDVVRDTPRRVVLARPRWMGSSGRLRVSVRGTPGDAVTLFMGRRAIRVGPFGPLGQRLTDRAVDLAQGMIPPGGVWEADVFVPGAPPTGTLLILQAEVLHRADGVTRLSNSFPLLTP